MFKKISNFKKGIIGTILLIILIPLINYFIIYLPFQNNFISAVAPLFFLIFLVTPYATKYSSLLGGFIGYFAYSYIIKMPVQLSILFSIATAMVLLFHNVLFKEEPEKKTHIVVNVLACLISASFYAWISSLANSITFRTSFNVAFQAYFYFGIISTIIIVPALTYFFGVKLNSKTEILRR